MREQLEQENITADINKQPIKEQSIKKRNYDETKFYN